MDVKTLVEVAPRDRFTRVCALTGAGISVAAGLQTFRGPDGLWRLSPEMERAMHAQLLPSNVDALWSVWGSMFHVAARSGPTAAHRALADAGASVITQNVDELHQRAGSHDVVEIHGSAGRARCLDEDFCGWIGPREEAERTDPPQCPQCGEPARPAVVLFGEMLDPEALTTARKLGVGVRPLPCGGHLGPGGPGVLARAHCARGRRLLRERRSVPQRPPRLRLPRSCGRRRAGGAHGVGALTVDHGSCAAR